MLKCPKCGNEESFRLDVRAIADYNQVNDSFDEIEEATFLDDGGGCSCKKCQHDAPIEEFETGE